jgi:hypothetical protein
MPRPPHRGVVSGDLVGKRLSDAVDLVVAPRLRKSNSSASNSPSHEAEIGK